MQMPGRSYTAPNGGYRYGFNGKEKDKEMHSLTAYDYGFRIYNPALGKFLSVDPLTQSYPWYTPYQFAGNKPIWAIDVDGLEELIQPGGANSGVTTEAKIQIVNGKEFIKQVWQPFALEKLPSPERKKELTPEDKVRDRIKWFEELQEGRDRANKAFAKVVGTIVTIFPVGKGISIGKTLITRVTTRYLIKSSVEAFVDVFAQLANNNWDVNKVDWIDVGANFLPKLAMHSKTWSSIGESVYKNLISASADFTTEAEGGLTTVFGDKKLSKAGVEAFVGIMFDLSYGKLNAELENQLTSAGMDKKSIESKMSNIVTRQRDVLLETFKQASQNTASNSSSNEQD